MGNKKHLLRALAKGVFLLVIDQGLSYGDHLLFDEVTVSFEGARVPPPFWNVDSLTVNLYCYFRESGCEKTKKKL